MIYKLLFEWDNYQLTVSILVNNSKYVRIQSEGALNQEQNCTPFITLFPDIFLFVANTFHNFISYT